MTADEFNENDDVLAAEYVVGLLPVEDRKTVERRMVQDAGFAAIVAGWQAHLSGFDSAYGSVSAPRRVKARIDRELFGARRRRMLGTFWGAVAASLLAALFVVNWLPGVSDADLRAELRGDSTGYEFTLEFDSTQASANMLRVTGDLPADRIYELWLLPPDAAPVSLGVFAQTGPVGNDVLERLAAGATLAVSLEPAGGSPTGAPTGPVLALGVLSDV